MTTVFPQRMTESLEKKQRRMASCGSRVPSAQPFQGRLHPIPQLQKMLGNQRVAQLIQAKRVTPDGKIIGLQPKQMFGAADDRYDQEVDRAARQVMNTQDGQISLPRLWQSGISQLPAGSVQRKASKDDEDKKKKAVKQHLDQQLNVAKLLDQAKNTQPDPSKGTMDPDNLYHNSWEMINAGKVLLSVLSPTHDAQTRNPLRTPLKLAYFDWHVKYPKTGGDYPADPADVSIDKGLQFAEVGVEAEMLAPSRDLGFLSLYTLGPPVSADFVKRNIVHEVQHFSDWHGPTLLAHRQLDDWKQVVEVYESEFRSFWIQPVPAPSCQQGICLAPPTAFNLGSPNQKAANTSPVDVSNRNPPCTVCPPPAGAPSKVRTNLKNERQENIFRHLLSSYKHKQFDCCYVNNREFRKEVDAYAIPRSINLINSVRLLELAIELGKLDRSMSKAEVSNTRFVELVRKLDPLDWLFLKDQQATPFWTALHLDAPDFVRRGMGNLSAQSKVPTLADIDRELGFKPTTP